MVPVTEPAFAPLPFVLWRGAGVEATHVMTLHEDQRLAVLETRVLTPEWIALARRTSGLLIATAEDPLEAVSFAATASLHVPIIVAIALPFKRRQYDVLRAGAAACLLLPLEYEDVDPVLQALQRQDTAAFIHSVSLMLDHVSRTMYYQGSASRLTQREYTLLYHLLAARGQSVSATLLLSSIWPSGAVRNRASLEVHVCLLRKKLARIGLADAIRTIRGYGYALAVGAAIRRPRVPSSENLSTTQSGVHENT